jgi:hypothetical protein
VALCLLASDRLWTSAEATSFAAYLGSGGREGLGLVLHKNGHAPCDCEYLREDIIYDHDCEM